MEMGHLMQKEKEKGHAWRRKSGRSIPANFTSIMSMVKWGGRGGMGNEQEICSKKDILGFHQ